jgi:aryl-alcohol dehydrogenase-like predicted oxidoreductase
MKCSKPASTAIGRSPRALTEILLRQVGPKSQPAVVDSQLIGVGPLQRRTVSLHEMTSNPQTAQNTPPRRILGPSHLSVGPIGLGCMTMTWAYGSRDRAESIATIRRAVELGVTLFDTADVYGPFTNEELVGEALQDNRHQIILATKCGLIVPNPKDYHQDASKFSITPNGRPEHVRQACEDSLRRLRTNFIDLYQLHRVDPKVPIEESVGEMAKLVSEGKVRFIGLSECTVEQLERAQRVHPITSVQSELSLWTRDPLAEVLPFCKEHQIGFLPFSPLGRGFLTGDIERSTSFAKDDFRSILPRFYAEALSTNLRIVEGIKEVASRHQAAPAQVALAWVLAQGEQVVPIPGSSKRSRLEQNVEAAMIRLSPEDLAELDALPAPVGSRY